MFRWRNLAIKFDQENAMQLTLKQCTIRPWRLDDAESLARHANNRKVWLAVRDTFPHPYTIEDAYEFLQKKMIEQSPTIFCIAIDGTAVGGIGIHLGRMCIGTQQHWVTGWASSSGDAEL